MVLVELDIELPVLRLYVPVAEPDPEERLRLYAAEVGGYRNRGEGDLPRLLVRGLLLQVSDPRYAEEGIVPRELLQQERVLPDHGEGVFLYPSVAELLQDAPREGVPSLFCDQPVPLRLYRLEQRPLVFLDGNHEVPLLGEDPGDDLPLHADGIYGDDGPVDVEEVEELRYGRYLVGLVVHGKGNDADRLSLPHVVEEIGRLLAVPLVRRRPYRLSVDVEHPHVVAEDMFRRIVHRYPFGKMLRQICPVGMDENTGNGIVGRSGLNAEKLPEVLQVLLHVVGHLDGVQVVAQDGADDHEMEVGELVPDASRIAVVGYLRQGIIERSHCGAPPCLSRKPTESF